LKESAAVIAERAELIEQFIDSEYHLKSPTQSLVRYALRHNVQGFDAVYLALAHHLDAQLATLDRGLRNAAINLGLWAVR
jgi:predicted nucleic acid-binding protein